MELASCMFQDWMHALCSSGGMGQHTANRFVLYLIRNTAVTLEQLSEFASRVAQPKKHGKLSRTFFEDRTVEPRTRTEKQDAHMRCFAAETSSFSLAAPLYWHTVGPPAGRLWLCG